MSHLLTLDHLAVSADPLEIGVSAVETALGVELGVRGKHDVMGTHNALMGLGPLYLEVIACDPEGTKPDHPRWFDLDRFSGPPRLSNWICRTTDLDAALATLGPGYGTPISLTRGPFSWRMAVPETGCLPFEGWAPALMQWECEAHPTQSLPESDLRLKSLRLDHPEAEKMAQALAPHMAPRTVEFAKSDTPKLTACFDTPQGSVEIS